MHRRAVQLVFLQGPWLRPSCWTTVQRLLESRGWETTRADLFLSGGDSNAASPTDANTVRGQTATLKQAIGTQYPPVVVAHSTSCFVVQKYLESFSVSGLIMLAPVPPEPATDGCLDRLLRADTALSACDADGVAAGGEEGLPALLRNGVGGDGRPGSAGGGEGTETLKRGSHREFLLDVGTHHVNLEPQPVPMQLICGTADHFVTALCVDATADYHELDSEDVVELEHLGHAAMLGDGAVAVAEAIHQWLDPRF